MCKVCKRWEVHLLDAIQHTLYAHDYASARQCPCGITANSYRGLKRHINVKHGYSTTLIGQRPQCLVHECGIMTDSNDLMAQHYKQIHELHSEEISALLDDGRQQHIAPRNCAYCSTSNFPTVREYMRHVVNQHPSRHRVITKFPTDLQQVSIQESTII